jgi:hypothetical protein
MHATLGWRGARGEFLRFSSPSVFALSPVPWTSKLRGEVKFLWGSVTECGVPAATVPEDFDVLEDLGACLRSGTTLSLVDQLDFGGAKELSATTLSQQLPCLLMLLSIRRSASRC